MAKVDDPAPGTNATYQQVEPPVPNELGQVAYEAYLKLPGVAGGKQGIWRADYDTMPRLVADTLSSNISSLDPRSVRINDGGTLSFAGNYLLAPGNSRSAIWHATPDASTIVVREGDLASGTPGSFQALYTSPINNASQFVIHGWSPPIFTTGRGVWSNSGPGGMHLVAHAGMPAPGTDLPFRSLEAPAINAQGRPRFLGS